MTPTLNQLATLCQRSYTDGPANLPWFTHERRVCIGRTDTQFVCGRIGNDIAIAFRGTSSITDWFINADLAMANGPRGVGKVARGFMRAADSALTEVARFIHDILEGDGGVYLTGHSLGGAIAVLIAELLKNAVVIPEVTTFGCPRIGDATFSANLRNITQYITISDKVPHLPPAVMGFRHATRIQHVIGGGTISLDEQACTEVFVPHAIGSYLAGLGAV